MMTTQSDSDFESNSELDTEASADGLSDHDDWESEELTVKQSDEASITHTANTPFPKHVAQILESFYARGMKGWGKLHRPDIIRASEATGLKQSQIEVGSSGSAASDACMVYVYPYTHVSHDH